MICKISYRTKPTCVVCKTLAWVIDTFYTKTIKVSTLIVGEGNLYDVNGVHVTDSSYPDYFCRVGKLRYLKEQIQAVYDIMHCQL